MNFEYRLRHLLVDRGITQKQLADMVGVTKGSVNKWVNGDNFPNQDKIIAMTKIFNCSTDYLMGNTDIPYPIKKTTVNGDDIIYIGDMDEESKQFIKNFIEAFKKSKKEGK